MSAEWYTVQELAVLSGVSVRTLHYYDEIELLTPLRKDNNYRAYGKAEVDRLQQILLYRHLGMKLEDIKGLLDDPSFDTEHALITHLKSLRQQQEQTQKLIGSVEKTLASLKGERLMQDNEKFEGFKQDLIEENEKKYGAEVRAKYGDETVDASNAKLAGMTEEQWQRGQDLDKAFKDKLREAMEITGDPASSLAQEACALHREWLLLFWQEGMYSEDAHLGLAEMYLADERFHHYLGVEGSKFFRDALEHAILAE